MAMRKSKTEAQELGDQGEEAVASWYRRQGFEILARNWRCFEGELDIVARRGRTIVVCEVKTRSTAHHMDPALAVGRAKQAKLRTAAFRWLDESQARGRVRFDVALVVAGRVQVIEGAF